MIHNAVIACCCSLICHTQAKLQDFTVYISPLTMSSSGLQIEVAY